MTENKSISTKASVLRRRAEEKIIQSPPEKMEQSLPEETQHILHELRVHQIELEIQNEELRTSHEKLDAAQARYFDLYDLAPVGYCTISEEGLILEANLTAVSILGMKRWSLIKQPFSQFIFPKDDNDIFYLHHRQIFETYKPQSFDLRMLKKDGTAFWANIVATAAQDANGATTCRIVLSDITERKRSEETLLAMAQEWKRTFDAISEAIWILDKDNVILRSNKAAELYFHRPCTEMVGKHCWEIVHGTTQPIRECPTMLARKSLHHESIELQIGEGFFNIDVDPILDANGQFSGAVHVVTDITERKRTEIERKKTEIQLHQSQKMEAIGQLAGGIAHDFNNMLTVINGHSQLALKMLDPSDPNYLSLKAILDAGQRSAELTKQLLAFARKQIITPKVLNINDTVEGMLKLLRRLIGEDIELSWNPAADLWDVKMDPSQVDQILANLLVNVRDAISGTGKVTIETGKEYLDEAICKTHPDAIPGKYVVMTVSDTGCGMDKKILEHVFEPFFTTKEVGKGTGLGLATVFGIVKQNNGFIDVHSEPGKGTTFKIYLPRHESGNNKNNKITDEPHILTGFETILLVEDQESMCRIAKILLEGLGYSVLSASNPVMAVKLSEEYKGEIHLLLTDVIMPEMSGRDLRDIISSARPGIKCLFMSGYSGDVIANKGILDDGIHFLQKPFSEEELSIKLRKLLAK